MKVYNTLYLGRLLDVECFFITTAVFIHCKTTRIVCKWIRLKDVCVPVYLTSKHPSCFPGSTLYRTR